MQSAEPTPVPPAPGHAGPVTSVPRLVQALRTVPLLPREQMDHLAGVLASRYPDPNRLARHLMRCNWLTTYQAEEVLAGRTAELVLGHYLLLEPLGAGGMGQVFKARHCPLDRVVALKVLQRKYAENPTLVQRFQREARAAARLQHPNVVMALDAGDVRGRHYLAMEYVEGSDLAVLVERFGPFDVAQACDVIRQAALGLQHAHERGIVHRDIKPDNLLLTASEGLVKILDLGLVRLDYLPDSGDGQSLTPLNKLLGTIDYIAPEQGRDAHGVDIRADLYSLGCTFYFLLAGRAPWAGVPAHDKLQKQQTEDPAPVESLRPGVPPAVAATVRKLMAKRPEDRFQTPAEVARVLAACLGQNGVAVPGAGRQPSVNEPTPPPGAVARIGAALSEKTPTWGTDCGKSSP
jgi:serine/threonine protein kinase